MRVLSGKSANNSSPDSSNLPQHTIDTLDDADLTSQFDFLALEQGNDDESTILNNPLMEGDSSNEIDHELLGLLQKQKRYFALLKTCESNTRASKELDNICQKARDEVQRVEKLHSDAKKFENKGNARIALEKFQQITGLVTDFPAIDSDIQRIQQTLALIEDINPDRAPELFESEISSKSAVADKKSTDKGKKSDSIPAPKTKNIKSQPAKDSFGKRGKSKFFLFTLLILTCDRYKLWWIFLVLLHR